MFTLQDIKDAHAKVQSGADFPRYIQDLIDLGVRSYTTWVADGHADYYGDDTPSMHSDPKYAQLTISDTVDRESFLHDLTLHQQWGTDYMTFCRDAAKAGVATRVIDMQAMTCTYYDSHETVILEEMIPSV